MHQADPHTLESSLFPAAGLHRWGVHSLFLSLMLYLKKGDIDSHLKRLRKCRQRNGAWHHWGGGHRLSRQLALFFQN